VDLFYLATALAFFGLLAVAVQRGRLFLYLTVALLKPEVFE
jgi:hypothetical protein